MEKLQSETHTSRLPKPVRITEQVWPEGTVPVVSVFCITYNHVKFIRDAIEGFLMQETTFPVEIFIHDDASTDGTPDIVREYAGMYPSLFKTVFQKENQYAIRSFGFFFEHCRKQRGEFTAFCEGDDYWTDHGKLERQVISLNDYPSCSGSFHQCAVTEVETGNVELLPAKGPVADGLMFNFRDVLTGYPFHTSTMMLRTEVLRALPPDVNRASVGDKTIQILATTSGPWIYCEGVMSVFRRFSESNFFHWDPRLMLPTLELAVGLSLSPADSRLARLALSEAYFDAAIWRRSYNDLVESRKLLTLALKTDLTGLVKSRGLLNIFKQCLAALLNLGRKHSWADQSRFAKK